MFITDIVTISCLLFCILRGFSRGFLRSIVGPLGLIIVSVVSFVYFSWTKNMLVSLCIGLFGNIALAWIFRLLLNSWIKMTNPQGILSLASRIGGAFLTLSWGMAMWLIVVLLLAAMPPLNPFLEKAYKDVHLSQTYRLIKPWDSHAIDKPTTEDDLKSLSEDARIQAILNDPEIAEAVEKKNYVSLMSNKKIAALIQDPEMMKKMLSIYKNMGQGQLKQSN